MKKRLHRLEARAWSFSSERPQQTIRVVVSSVCSPSNLAKSKCKRTLHGNGLLTEFLELDGSRKELSREELDRFVASFPVGAA